MKSLYYVVWSDAFCRYRRHHPKDKKWVSKVFQLLTNMNAINVATIIIWLRIFDGWTLPEFAVADIFPGTVLDNVLFFYAWFYFPFMVLNSLFVLLNKKYLFIIKKYGKAKHNIAFIYCLTSALVGFVTIMCYGIKDNFGLR